MTLFEVACFHWPSLLAQQYRFYPFANGRTGTREQGLDTERYPLRGSQVDPEVLWIHAKRDLTAAEDKSPIAVNGKTQGCAR